MVGTLAMACEPRARKREKNASESSYGVIEQRTHAGGAREKGCCPLGVDSFIVGLARNIHSIVRTRDGVDHRIPTLLISAAVSRQGSNQSGSSKPFATVEYEDCMIDT